MALICGKLCFMGNLFEVLIYHLLASAQIVFLSLYPLLMNIPHLTVKSLLHDLISSLSLITLFYHTSCCLDRPKRVWFINAFSLFIQLILYFPLCDLFLPELIVLFLHLLPVSLYPHFLVIIVFNLLRKLLSLPDKDADFCFHTALDLLSFIFCHAYLARVCLKQAHGVYAKL